MSRDPRAQQRTCNNRTYIGIAILLCAAVVAVALPKTARAQGAADEVFAIELLHVIATGADPTPGVSANAPATVEAVQEFLRRDVGRTLRVRSGVTQVRVADSTTNDVVDELVELGYDDTNTIYLVFAEMRGSGACGINTRSSRVEFAILWMPTCDTYPRSGQQVFPFGPTYLVLHELIHALGAVLSCAPNHDGSGHVSDSNRDMLYQGPLRRDWDNLTLDVGNDDYYDHAIPGCFDIADSPFWATGFGPFVEQGLATWQTTGAGNQIALNESGDGVFIALKDNGDLYARRFSRSAAGFDSWVRLGAGSWGSAGVAIAPDGRVEIVATKLDGKLYTRSWLLSGQFGPWTNHGLATWQPSAQPSVATDGATITVAAVKRDGRLYTRQRSTSGSWGAFQRQGLLGWAHADVDMATNGDLWLVGSKVDGRLYIRKRESGRWRAFEAQGLATWSRTATPSISAQNGEVVYAALKADGRLYTRRQADGVWQGFVRHGATSWSGASVDLGEDGAIALAAAKNFGRLYTRMYRNGWQQWFDHGADTWSAVASPSIATNSGGSMFLGVKQDRRLFTRET